MMWKLVLLPLLKIKNRIFSNKIRDRIKRLNPSHSELDSEYQSTDLQHNKRP